MPWNKNHIILILLLGKPSYGLPANAKPCDVKNVLLKLSYSQPSYPIARLNANPGVPHYSDWGQYAKNTLLAEDYKKYHFLFSENHSIPVSKGSYAEMNGEMVNTLEDVIYFQLNPKRFYEEFTRTKGWEPSHIDFRDFYKNQIQIYSSGMKKWIGELQKINRLAASRANISLDEKILRLESEFSKLTGRKTVQELISTTDLIHTRIIGDIGEAFAYSNLPNILWSSKKLSEIPMVQVAIQRKFSELNRLLTKKPELMDQLIRDYPLVFNSRAHFAYQKKTNREILTIKERLDLAKQWINSKEIDFARSNGNKISWLEVKSKASTVGMREFKSRNGSMMEQIEGVVELVDLLNLRNQISLEYFVNKGVTEEVKKHLNSIGVSILELTPIERLKN